MISWASISTTLGIQIGQRHASDDMCKSTRRKETGIRTNTLYGHITGLSCLSSTAVLREALQKGSERTVSPEHCMDVVLMQRSRSEDGAYNLEDFLKHHVAAGTSQPSPMPKISGIHHECSMIFHITGYQIFRSKVQKGSAVDPHLNEHQVLDERENWPSGYMHDRLTRIRRVVNSVCS